MLNKVRGLLLTLLLTSGALLAVPGQAQATTAIGSWWTNHSYCYGPGAGKVVDTQARYQNYNIGTPWTRMLAVSTSTSGHGSIVRMQVWSYADLPQQLDAYLNFYPASGYSNYTKTYTSPGFPTFPADGGGYGRAVYKITMSDGYTCQGQWNIGQ
jgi:hypothetical protein